MIDRSTLARAIGGDPVPLVLAAEPEATGHFRKLTKLPQLYAEALQPKLLLNPYALSESDLLQNVVAPLQPAFDRELAGVLDQMNARLGTAEPTVAIRLEEILPAPYDGRVDAIVVESRHALGTPDEHEDRLNEPAAVSLLNGGRAFAVPRDRMPRRAPAAAIFRY